MADEADMAEVQIETARDYSIKSIQDQARAINIEGSGTCQECGAMVRPVWVGQKMHIGRWCSTYCRDAWERGQ